MRNGWTRTELPAEFYRMWKAEFGDVAAPDVFERGPVRAIVGREPVTEGDLRWHVSVSRPDRLPLWDDLVTAAHDLRPGVVFVVGVPPRSWWINVHKYTLHMWEVRDPFLIEQWRSERRGDKPT